MNLATAKKSLNAIATGKLEATKELMDSIFKFASDSKKPLTELLNKANVAKAIEKGIIQAPKVPGKKGKETTVKEQAAAVLDKKKEQEEKAAASKAKYHIMQGIVKANTTAKPSTLFRLVWKEKREIMGMDVLHIHPISRKSPNLIGIMLEYDKDEKSFRKLDIIGSIDLNQLEFDGKKPIIFDDAGVSKELGIYLPKPKDETSKPVSRKALKKPVSKPADTNKAEGKKEEGE